MLKRHSQYLSEGGKQKKALLPSFSTFGAKKTSQMIAALTAFNPSITIDPQIARILSHSGSSRL
jgi:hypothetical protein